MREKYRLIREAAYEHVFVSYMTLIKEPGFRGFVCMYIGEGYKRCRNSVSLNNSDPAVVKLANYWICRLSRNPVGYALQHHADQEPDELKRFWAKGLGISAEAIKTPWRSRYGLLCVRASDTLLRAELQAWMDCVQEEWLDSLEVGA
jgi:hypothetical protein